MSTAIDSSLCCPACRTPLSATSSVLSCATCDTDYPPLGRVPFLFPHPQLALARWEARAHHELQVLAQRQARCEAALKNTNAVSTKTRLSSLATGYAGQINCLTELLEALLANQPSSDHTTYAALKTELLENTTTLFSYVTNLFRDWCWGDTENAQALDMLQAVARGEPGRTLVLGAGAGRLAWDLAGTTTSEVVAVDINPFTTLVAAQLCGGSSCELWEFPMAPVAASDVAIKRTLRAPAPRANLHWLLADARALPLLPGGFDTVVTPWFTDIVAQSPRQTAAQINTLLAPQGRWLNFGSVTFANTDPAEALLLQELTALVAEQGFDEPVVFEERGPYLCSPHSRYGRQELLHAFAAGKRSKPPGVPVTVAPPAQPDWLTAVDLPIPALPRFREQAMATQVHAYLMSLIDGQRSVTELAQVLEQQQLMSAREAVPVIQDFLRKMLA